MQASWWVAAFLVGQTQDTYRSIQNEVYRPGYVNRLVRNMAKSVLGLGLASLGAAVGALLVPE